MEGNSDNKQKVSTNVSYKVLRQYNLDNIISYLSNMIHIHQNPRERTISAGFGVSSFQASVFFK